MHLEIATPDWLNIPNDEFFQLQVFHTVFSILLTFLTGVLHHKCLHNNSHITQMIGQAVAYQSRCYIPANVTVTNHGSFC